MRENPEKLKKMNLKIQQNIPLAPYTTLKIGGPADYFVIAKSQNELVEALNWAKEKKMAYFILGNGSNVLVSDQGFRGLIIQLRITDYELKKTTLRAGAGASMSTLAKITAEKGLTGLEFGIGIPGTVGGAIYGNAGAFGQEIKDVLTQVKILMPKTDAAIHAMDNSACELGYRTSVFKKYKDWVIIEALFELTARRIGRAGKKECEKRIKQILKDKKNNQPMGQKSAGSIFKNPPGYKAWKLICEAEMKGFQIGQAKVSDKHANYIINTSKATAEHVIMLIAMIKQRVRDKFGIQLHEEIQYVGFNNQ
ncbi:MAG: UDP-N-acetylmuramate dehydrogenase [Candidatus Jacksonbacteria bacterium]